MDAMNAVIMMRRMFILTVSDITIVGGGAVIQIPLFEFNFFHFPAVVNKKYGFLRFCIFYGFFIILLFLFCYFS